MLVYSCCDKVFNCVWIDGVASQYPKFAADIILLFADIVPETVVKLFIVKIFVVVFAETIKLFVVVVPDIVKLLLIDSELVIIDELLLYYHYILYNPFKLFIII